MKMQANKGMLLESVINNSIKYYQTHKIALLRKQFTPITINKIKNGEVIGSFGQKCDVDYYGLWNKKFIAIEAKQCDNDIFKIERINRHQKQFLELINELDGLSYVVVYFRRINKFYLVSWDKLKSSKTKTLRVKWFDTFAINLPLIFPGWIDIFSAIKQQKTKK